MVSMTGALLGYQNHDDVVAVMSRRQMTTREKRLQDINEVSNVPKCADVHAYATQEAVSAHCPHKLGGNLYV